MVRPALLLAVLLAVLPVPSICLPEYAQERSATNQPSFVIDINQATAEDFQKLPGIGPALARRIVTFREKHGPFRRVEDLLAIRGIGHKKWKAIRAHVIIGETSKKK